jgi:hypothetical protein
MTNIMEGYILRSPRFLPREQAIQEIKENLLDLGKLKGIFSGRVSRTLNIQNYFEGLGYYVTIHYNTYHFNDTWSLKEIDRVIR